MNTTHLEQSRDGAGLPDGQTTLKIESTGRSVQDVGLSRSQRRHPFRWLLLALCFVLAFLLGFASGNAYAAQDKPPFKTAAVDERKCVQLHVRPGVMWPLSTSDIRIEVDIARHRHHRQLVITWDGGSSGGGSSVQSLDGEGEPFLHVRTIKDAPAAPWQFVAEVYDDHGRVVGRDTAEIRMPEGDQ